MKAKVRLLFAVALICLCFPAAYAWAGSIALDDPIMTQAQKAVEEGLAQLKAQPGQGLLVLTNAGYAEIKDNSTEAFLDVAAKVAGVSQGSKSLLMVHSSIQAPLWFALFKKDGYGMAYAKYSPEGFKVQVVDASADQALNPEGWKKAAAVMGPSTFGILSIAHSWAKGAPWPLLLAACFHNHFCPGLNGGYVAVEYVKKNLPLGPGDSYVFVGAPSKCFMDALQVLFDATPGKAGSFGMPLSGKAAAKYFGDKVGALGIAMRVNAKADKCDGQVLGFDWAQVGKDTGGFDLAPKGGKSNPMFWISRVQMSAAMAAMPMDKKLPYIVMVKEFSGPASLADKVAVGGGDPYAVVWGK